MLMVTTHRKRSQARPEFAHHDTSKPDIDNILKAVMDGLVDAGALEDDSQVISVDMYKGPRVEAEDWTELILKEVI